MAIGNGGEAQLKLTVEPEITKLATSNATYLADMLIHVDTYVDMFAKRSLLNCSHKMTTDFFSSKKKVDEGVFR